MTCESKVEQFMFFRKGASLQQESQSFVARVSSGMLSRDQLFDSLSAGLRFPDYFGRNWDALHDCICDLAWIKHKRVILWHDDVPQIGSSGLRMYIDILLGAIMHWRHVSGHELVVAFPYERREMIAAILRNDEQGYANTKPA